MLKKNYKITGMYCSSCSMVIEGIEDELPGIRSVSASYQKERVEVVFDEKVVSEQQIIEAISKKGYQVARR